MRFDDATVNYYPDRTNDPNYRNYRNPYDRREHRPEPRPYNCSEENEIIKQNRQHGSEQMEEADKALANGDLEKFKQIFTDPLISPKQRDQYLRNNGEEKIEEAFGSWIFNSKTQAEKEALDYVSDGQNKGEPSDTPSGQMLACEGRLLTQEAKAAEELREEQLDVERRKAYEDEINATIERIPDTVRTAASEGKSGVSIMIIDDWRPYTTASEYTQPKLDPMQQKVFDRLTELNLNPSFSQLKIYSQFTWVMYANW